MAINCFLLEEHNEALLVWIYAIKKDIISKSNNVLLHFDDHSDMGIPRFNKSINEILSWDYIDIQKFVYSEVSIATFIVPSIYLGIFNDVKWIRYDAGENKQVQFIMSSYNNDGRKLISSASASKVSKGKEYSYAKFNPSAFFDTEFGSNQDTVLDIDLDYFSCADDTYFNNEIIIETTKTEYEDFVSDKYHKFNFILGKVEAIEKEGKYYFIINYFKYTYPESRKVGEDTILARIDEFIGLLKRKNIKPKVITICRSRFSGFTPSDQWEYIESNLLDRLNDFYALELTKINEILSE